MNGGGYMIRAEVRKHMDKAGVWCVVLTSEGSCRERIISTHSSRDGAVMSANQINRADSYPGSIDQ